MEHVDRADAENKALINKLADEFNQELKALGVRVSALEDKVNPWSFNGDFRLRGLSINDKIAPGSSSSSYWQSRVRFGIQYKMDQDSTFFARFSNRSNFGEQSDTHGNVDQYGVKLNAGSWKFVVGRQDVLLGQGLILGTGSDASSIDNKFDGLVASTTAGTWTFNVVGGKTTNDISLTKEWYGADATTKIGDKTTLGVAYAHSNNNGGTDKRNVWGVNTSIAAGSNFKLNAEWAKSDKNNDNKAYFVGGTFSFNKDSFTVQYNNVEANSVDPYNSAYGAVAYPYVGRNLVSDYKGWSYTYNHPMSKVATFNLNYLDLQRRGVSGHDKELAGTVTWSF